VVAAIASTLVRDTVDTDILIAQKWANLEDLKSKITLHKRKINKLTYPGMIASLVLVFAPLSLLLFPLLH
jgi:hypothetical protein